MEILHGFIFIFLLPSARIQIIQKTKADFSCIPCKRIGTSENKTSTRTITILQITESSRKMFNNFTGVRRMDWNSLVYIKSVECDVGKCDAENNFPFLPDVQNFENCQMSLLCWKKTFGWRKTFSQEKIFGQKKSPWDEKSVSVRQYLDNHESIPIGSLSFYHLINKTIAALFDKIQKIQTEFDFLLSVHG